MTTELQPDKHSDEQPSPGTLAILQRFNYENDLLVTRTSSVLALNGLMVAAVSVGDELPWTVKLLIALAMVLLNAMWAYRARSAFGFIERLLNATYYSGAALPADAELHKQWLKEVRGEQQNGKMRLLSSFLSSYGFMARTVPLTLLACWIIGIGLFTWHFTASAKGRTGHFQIVPGITSPTAEVYVFNSETGDIYKVLSSEIPTK